MTARVGQTTLTHMLRRHALAILALTILASGAMAQKKRPRVKKWDAFKGGLSLQTKDGRFHTTLREKELKKMAARIGELKPFYEKHFGSKLERPKKGTKKGWSFIVLKDRKEYQKYAKEVTKGRQNVQGQCMRNLKVVVVCDHKRYGWSTTLSHEYAHAHYDSQGPIWLREGIASLAEVAEAKGKQMVIPVNPPRLRGLRLYQRQKHYLQVSHLLRGEKEPDGYGYSYEHGWSLHYFLYSKDPQKYRAFLAAVRKKTGRDLSGQVVKFFRMDLKKLDERWKDFFDKLRVKGD